MRWIAILACAFVWTGSALAAGSDELYLDIYNEILQADSLAQGGHSGDAVLRYVQAQTDLQKLQTDHPSWNPDIVKYRLDYLAEKIQGLAKFLPSTNTTAVPTTGSPAEAPPPAQPAVGQPEFAALQQENSGYKEQIRSLGAANTELEGKLKEALSVQPAAVSPAELAKAEARIVALQKERDLLAVALEHEKTSNAEAIAAAKAAAAEQAVAEFKARADADEKKSRAELEMAKNAAAESERKLADASKELETLKASRAVEADQEAANKARAESEVKKAQEQMAQLKEASAESAKIMAAANRELELLRTAHPPEIQPTEPNKQIPEESDQLKQLLGEISKDEAEIARLKQAVADGEQKLAAANNELDELKKAHPANAPSTDQTKAILAERDKLKDELAQRSKDLADTEAHHSEELLNIRTALQQAEQRRDELEKKIAAASALDQSGKTPAAATNAPTAENPQLVEKVEQLQARVAVLESNTIPYTEEELALLKKSAAVTNATPPELAAVPPSTVAPGDANTVDTNSAFLARHIHSSKELPPGSGPLWESALRASMAGDFATAEQKYTEVLHQDETNVYVLAFLANTQFAAGKLADCEKSVNRALAIDPEDPGSLYLLGLLRYRQNRLDEALDALSLSAKINPTNAATQNFLGCVLADKGLRPAAETAMRKALQSDPDYADAHFNLAVVYAGNQPPSLELARWHYKRALVLGHAKSATLEKLLEDDKAAPATQ